MGKFKELRIEEEDQDLEFQQDKGEGPVSDESREETIKRANEIFKDKKVVTIKTVVAQTMLEDIIDLMRSLGIAVLMEQYTISSDQKNKIVALKGDPDKYLGVSLTIEEENVHVFIEAVNSLKEGLVVKTPEAKAVEEFYKTGKSRKETLH